ncbi:hypothetical protein CFC21_076489 [Triticum aestivum]|uniref:Uncharacterized protein n=2 Tax=Triticum aestivum TaxID=4565 RepID=A0A3B6MMP2_WHEAT|nr:hypothetical protein CFC21_076489 [Triticum aestivum]
MQGHDPVGGADELAADEDCRDGRRTPKASGEVALHVAAAWVLVQLVDRGAHAEAREEACHRVAHRAVARGEDHHRFLGRQLCHPLHRV